jgi:hypothetical protein
LWLSFFALVSVLLLVFRVSRVSGLASDAYWTAAWFVIGLSFAGLVYPMYEHGWLGATLDEPSDSPGTDAAVMFVSAYLVERFWAIKNGRWVFSMSAACALSIVLVDAAFALDSAFAVVSVSKTTFIVASANVLATIATRRWFFIAARVENLPLPRIAVGLLLALIGAKLLAHRHVQMTHRLWLGVIAALVLVGASEMILTRRRTTSARPGDNLD